MNLLRPAVRAGVASRGRLLAIASRLLVVVLAMIAIFRLTSHRHCLFVGEIGCLSILIAHVRRFLLLVEFAQRMATVLRLIVINVVDVAQRTRVIVDRLKVIVGLGRFLAHVVDAAIAQVNVARALGILPVVRMDRLKTKSDERER